MNRLAHGLVPAVTGSSEVLKNDMFKWLTVCCFFFGIFLFNFEKKLVNTIDSFSVTDELKVFMSSE